MAKKKKDDVVQEPQSNSTPSGVITAYRIAPHKGPGGLYVTEELKISDGRVIQTKRGVEDLWSICANTIENKLLEEKNS